MTPPVVRVTWVDSVAVRGEVGDHEIADTFRSGVGTMESVGFLVRDEPDRVVIAQEWQPADNEWRWLMSIPRCAIRRVRYTDGASTVARHSRGSDMASPKRRGAVKGLAEAKAKPAAKGKAKAAKGKAK